MADAKHTTNGHRLYNVTCLSRPPAASYPWRVSAALLTDHESMEAADREADRHRAAVVESSPEVAALRARVAELEAERAQKPRDESVPPPGWAMSPERFDDETEPYCWRVSGAVETPLSQAWVLYDREHGYAPDEARIRADERAKCDLDAALAPAAPPDPAALAPAAPPDPAALAPAAPPDPAALAPAAPPDPAALAPAAPPDPAALATETPREKLRRDLDENAKRWASYPAEVRAAISTAGPRFCACGRVESDCDQSRASCPKADPASEGDDETDIIIAGRQVPFVQVGMIVHPDDCLNCERDGSPLWCSALVCDIHDDDETARFGMMATLLFRNGERREEPCDELRRRWRLARDFDQGRVYTGRWGAIPRGSVWPVAEVNEDA